VLSDRAVFRDCVVGYLRHNGFSGTTGCPRWTAAHGDDERTAPDLLLLDAGQEHEDPADELRRVRAQWPSTTAVGIGTPIQLAAQAADADGWIDVAEPGTRLSMVARAATVAKNDRRLGMHPPAEVERQLATWRALTLRQRQVLALLGFGLEVSSAGRSSMEVRRSILIVDDNVALAENIAEVLALAGYRTGIAASAEEALPRALDDEVGFVITDFRLPGMDGAELVSCVRRKREEVGFVVMSAHTDERVQERASDVGASFLAKPVSLQRLADLIRDSATKPRAVIG
jgi:DNA-binding response OmpR family regulator